MPNDADSKAGHTQNGEGGFSKHFISLTLPLLSLHWALLPTIKSSFERNKDDYIKAIGNFVWFQMHALGMTLDPTRKLRSHLDDDLENKLRTELTQMLDLWAARVVTLVEIEEVILPRLIKRLNDIKSEKRDDIKNEKRDDIKNEEREWPRKRQGEDQMERMQDLDPVETGEWVDSLRAVLRQKGSVRATYLLEMLAEEARRAGIVLNAKQG